MSEPSAPKWQMPGMPVCDAPPPVFTSWADYLKRTTRSQRMVRCYAAAKKANRKRLLSRAPRFRLSGLDVWAVIEAARGRCVHCGSLAVETRPSAPNGAPIAWAHVGRRVGSLEHVCSRISGGDNGLWNLAWACLWCNDHVAERRPNALDHGGFYPEEPMATEPMTTAPEATNQTRKRDDDDEGLEMYPDHECPCDVGHAE
jgi:hypothetical protein